MNKIVIIFVFWVIFSFLIYFTINYSTTERIEQDILVILVWSGLMVTMIILALMK